ncbi:kelch repeat protein [Teladorsagia circumcincta]|uniref:Kelch repeat protein n=1 Tax=Teladorsagia circumcincta TaxID=45464 RepID=A0A2G9UR10_TELCI|nr:kelch repeat protein [Teladorsagia circumcincta]
MVGEQENGGSVTTGRQDCTPVISLDHDARCRAAALPAEQEPGPSTPIISTKDEVIVETSDGGLVGNLCSSSNFHFIPLPFQRKELIQIYLFQFLLSRCRLASESLFFRALFHGSYLESKSSRVRLTCVNSSDFRACLSLTAHMYNGTTPKFSAEAAMNLMVTASFLQMSTLMEELINTVVYCVHPSNRLAAYRKSLIRSAVLSERLWTSIIKEFRLHLNNGDYERMTETEILTALADERLDIECKEEEPLINNWIAKNPKNNERMMRLKSENLKRRGTDGRLAAVVRDRVPREIVLAIGGWSTGGPSDIVEVFNPRAHTWVVPEAAVREIPRAYHGAVLCAEKMIIFGGFNGREYFQHAKIFDLNKKVKKAYVSSSNLITVALRIGRR